MTVATKVVGAVRLGLVDIRDLITNLTQRRCKEYQRFIHFCLNPLYITTVLQILPRLPQRKQNYAQPVQ